MASLEGKMKGYYSASDIARMIGVSSRTIKFWEGNSTIPQSFRMGIQRRRMWTKSGLRLILQYARDLGYPVHDWGVPPDLQETDDTSS